MIIKMDILQTVALAVCVYYFGQFVKNKVSIFQKYCIPAPVIGGVVFALLSLALRMSGLVTFEFTTTLQNVFMTMFFTSVGFTASFKVLKKGSVAVLIFLAVATLLVIIQNIAGVGLAGMFGLDPRLGLAMGSIPMVGGHGTSGSFGPLLEEAGVIGANVVALSAATFGLVAGSMIGGPIARRLIEKNGLKPSKDGQVVDTDHGNIHALTQPSMLNAFAIIFLCMGVGSYVSTVIKDIGVTVPTYIGAMIVALIIRNICDWRQINCPYKEIDIVGSVGLALFLSMALMTLKLWELLELAGPMIAILLAQTIIMAIFSYFITFKIMGKDYDAAVLCSAICGFGMGATPNAIANMDAITNKYGYSAKAYLVVPIVGGMFIDITNAAIITAFVNFLG